MMIQFEEGKNSPSQEFIGLVEKNNKELQAVVPKNSNITIKKLKMMESIRRVGSKNAAQIVTSIKELNEYSDIIIDISSLPKGIYFPVIGKILTLLDQNKSMKINLHILVSENFVIDKSIKERGIAEDARA